MSTANRWCKIGKIPAIPEKYGNKITYKVSQQTLALLEQEQAKQDKPGKKALRSVSHKEMVPAWESAMAKGTLTGKIYSRRTVDDYLTYANWYFERHSQVDARGLKRELMRIPVSQFAKREHYFKAMLCLGRFLIQEEALDEAFVGEVAQLRPKRHTPPKKFTVKEEDIPKLLAACRNPQDTLIVQLLFSTGVRVSKACALKLSDIDLEAGRLIIQCGKGGKRRELGICQSLAESILAHEVARKKRAAWLLFDKYGKVLTARGLHNRLARIGEDAKVSVSPHAMRRAFVTTNALKGRSLVLLQRACGHTRIETTRSYCLEEQEQVIKAMQEWD